MAVEFTRSWNDEEVERFRESWVRFVETEMQPQDAEARKRGYVGRALPANSAPSSRGKNWRHETVAPRAR